MIRSVLKNGLKVIRCLPRCSSTERRRVLACLACILCLLLSFPALSGGSPPDGVRITQPRNGFFINRYNFDAYLINGTADAGKAVAIFANGILMETASIDTEGRFSVKIDFSNQIEGPVTLLALQEGLRSIPLTGTYDMTPPKITGAAIEAESISITFNESNLKNAGQEQNYRFSPSLNFKTLGGADDIARMDDFSYRLSMKSVPAHEIVTLALSGITDAAGNRVESALLTINDADGDRMADSWEAEHGLDPVLADAQSDDDGDGFSNYQEYLARSHPFAVLSAPIEIRDSIPRDDAGLVNFAWVPDETGFAVLIRSAHGIDTHASDTVRFTIDDGLLPPYVRDLRSDTVRTIKLDEDPDEQVTVLWAVYDRFLETYIPMTYPLNAVIDIKVEVRDIQNNILQPPAFEFKIETLARKAASRQNLPETDEFYMIDPNSGDPYDAGIEIIDGELSGAKVVYSSREPLTPAFGPLDGIEEINLDGIQAAGQPVNLIPHTVFDAPVKLFIPLAEDVDITTAGLAYHDGTQWLAAADADGNVLSDGEGWMVPGSRVNHAETRPALIEVQVYHFSGTQAVVFAAFDGTSEESEKERTDGTHVFVNANCFINSVVGGAEFGFAALIGLIGFVGFLIYFTQRRRDHGVLLI